MTFHRTAAFLFVCALVSAGGVPRPAASAEASAVLPIATWVDTLAFDQRVAEGIGLFAAGEGEGFDEDYAQRLAAAVRRLVASDVERQMRRLSEGARDRFIEVVVLDAGFTSAGGEPPDNELEREFERSFVRTEVLAFFAGTDTPPAEALHIYTDPEFRKKVTPRLARIWEDNGNVCVDMGGVRLLVDPMKYCDRVEDLIAEDVSVQHAQTVRNEGGKGHQQVFFKESVKTFVRLPDGLVFHYINYSRTVGLGGVEKRIARGKIKDSEKRAVEELGRRLGYRADQATE